MTSATLSMTSGGEQEQKTAPVTRTVLLVEDHALVRLGTDMLLGSLPGIACRVLHCTSLSEARTHCAGSDPIDLVLLDLNLCDSKGLQGLRLLRQDFPDVKIVVMTGTQDEFVVHQAQAMGAKGYLLKSWTPQHLRAALQGLLAPDANAQGSGLDRYPRLMANRSLDRVAELGPRHLEILELILSGCNNREIANTTGLSIGSIKNYVSAILLAMDVRSRGHLISLFH